MSGGCTYLPVVWHVSEIPLIVSINICIVTYGPKQPSVLHRRYDIGFLEITNSAGDVSPSASLSLPSSLGLFKVPTLDSIRRLSQVIWDPPAMRARRANICLDSFANAIVVGRAAT
jgi:hypothetical protein